MLQPGPLAPLERGPVLQKMRIPDHSRPLSVVQFYRNRAVWASRRTLVWSNDPGLLHSGPRAASTWASKDLITVLISGPRRIINNLRRTRGKRPRRFLYAGLPSPLSDLSICEDLRKNRALSDKSGKSARERPAQGSALIFIAVRVLLRDHVPALRREQGYPLHPKNIYMGIYYEHGYIPFQFFSHLRAYSFGAKIYPFCHFPDSRVYAAGADIYPPGRFL